MTARILYLDDEEPLVFIVKRMLEHLGHKVSGFTSSDAALAAFKTTPQDFDLVLSDMSMPGMSGIEFAAEVLAVRPETLVVIVSGFVEPRDAERARAVGVRHVVRKPNTIAELKELVSGLLP